MNYAELAKALLVSDNVITPIIADITDGVNVLDRNLIMDYNNNYAEQHLLKIVAHVDVRDWKQFLNLRPKTQHCFLDWHLENQDLPRSRKDSFVYDNSLIYINELLTVGVGDIQEHTVPKMHPNPFEQQYLKPQHEMAGVSADLYFTRWRNT